MDMQTFREVRNKDAITVSLRGGLSDDTKSFHCPSCGKIAFKHKSDVRIIIPGEPGYLQAPIELQCNGAVPCTNEFGERIMTKCKQKIYVT